MKAVQHNSFDSSIRSLLLVVDGEQLCSRDCMEYELRIVLSLKRRKSFSL